MLWNFRQGKDEDFAEGVTCNLGIETGGESSGGEGMPGGENGLNKEKGKLKVCLGNTLIM